MDKSTHAKLLSICRRIAGPLGEDLFQHTYLLVHDKHPENFEAYFISVAKNEYRNQKSQFNKQHLSQQVYVDAEVDTSKLEDIHRLLTTPEKKTDKDLLRQFYYLYLHYPNLSAFAKFIGISRNTCKKYVNEYERHIANRVNSIISD